MSEDANQSDEVLMPSTTSGEGIEAHLEAAESSPASEDQHEEKSNGVQARINDLTAKRYQAERERDELKAKLESSSSVVAQPQAPAVVHNVDTDAPKLPDDIYDEEAMRSYHESMLKHQQEVAKKQAKALFDEQQQSGARAAQEAKAKEQINSYVNNAIKDGVDLDKLKNAESILISANISAELGQYLTNDPNGGKITTYLADNPQIMYEVLSMDPMSAAVKIASEVKPKVLSQTPAVSNAPQPIAPVRGGGVEVKDEFDRIYAGYEII